jgi:hypothetical protein
VSRSEVALHADFNLDTIGERPSTDPPGDPDGDTLRMSESGGSVRVQESFGDLTDQPTVVTRSRNGYQIYLAGIVDPDLQECSFYTVSWRSLVAQNVQFFYMSFADANSRHLASVEYRAGGTHSVNSHVNEVSAEYTPNVAEFFELELDIETKTLSLSIDGVPMTEVEGLEFISTFANGLKWIGTDFGMLDLYSVAIDDLHVEASGCAQTPTEEGSWGAVKALYR